MEEKKEIKISLSTFLLIIALIVIIVMAFFIYKLNNKEKYDKRNVAELNQQISELKQKINSVNKNTLETSNKIIDIANENEENEENIENTENTNNIINEAKIYNENFNKSVYEILDSNSCIEIPIWAYSNYSALRINNKHEAYWNNQGNNIFPETSNTKVADDVINAWYCPLGQDIESNACLIFLKENGSVTFIRFYLDEDGNGNTFVNCTKEQKLNDISNISNILITESGFYGVIFIQEDGNAIRVPLTKLDDLTNQN